MQWADTNEWHPNPSTRLRAFHELVRKELESGAKHIRLVGEPVWPAASPDLVREWQRYESVLNEVLGPLPVSLVCTYEASRLDPEILATAHRTHPIVHGPAVAQGTEYEDPAKFLRRWTPRLDPPPVDAARMSEPLNLQAARRFLLERATNAGLQPWPAIDLCIAANEVLTNALVHGGPPVAMAAWSEDGRFTCDIEDRGSGIADPFASYRPPAPLDAGGRGLWLARQLVDLVQIVSTSGGTLVRLHVTPH